MQTLIVSAGITEYGLDAPSGTEPNHVKAVLRKGKPLAAATYEDAIMLIEQSDRSYPQYYAQYDNANVLIGPKPVERESLKVIYTLKPTQSSSSIPDTVGNEWREALVSGALFRLQMMSGQPWLNPNAANANAQIYERAVAKAIRQAKYGHGGAPLTVTPREFT